jgi:hypothetical protein
MFHAEGGTQHASNKAGGMQNRKRMETSGIHYVTSTLYCKVILLRFISRLIQSGGLPMKCHLLLFAIILTGYAQPSPTVDYARDVEPLLKARCYSCHGEKQQMRGLRLDSKDSASAAAALLIPRVTGANGLMAMPPTGKRLTTEEVATIRAWVDTVSSARAPVRQGHWAFQPVTRPAVPETKDARWPRNAIDSFILARLERDQIKPSPEAGKRTLLRRVSLDLTGLPPTPREMAEFLADTRTDAYERIVDRLLASPHFGERWARPWLDRARYADSDGYEKDWFRPWAWRFRDWVIDAFNRDLPFDEFTVEQIAGDLLPNATEDQLIATGFHRNTLTNREGGIDNAQFRFESTIDRTNTVGSVWLGLTVGCAQCHDHKYDPIRQKDYYSLFAYFDNVEEVDIEAPLPGELGPYLAKRTEYRAKRDELLKAYKVPELQAAWEADMLEAAAHPGKRTDWDLAWDCLLKLTEGGWDGEKIIRKKPEERTVRERDALTDHFIRNYHFAVGQKRFKEAKLPELDTKLTALKGQYPQISEAMAIVERPQQGTTHLRERGDFKTLGPETPPAIPAIFSKRVGATRLDLAQWMVSKDNPLTSRVAVNWIWQELFGNGIVKSSDDFGVRGDKPTHPELLDWLASNLMNDGWSIKRTIRLIVTSATYRQSSHARPDLQTADPANALLARQSRLRLPAELIRDSALYVSGLLDTDIGGRSIRPPQPAGVAELGYGKKESSWVVSGDRDRYRRGLYIQFQRATPYPLLMNFDAPKTTVTACRRERSNTPLQALNLLNDPAFVEAAEALAFETKPGDFKTLFMRALGREPNSHELERIRAYYQKQVAAHHNDPAQPDGKSMDAWAAVSSVLLNLDEFITRE